jgi:hypothetical protein
MFFTIEVLDNITVGNYWDASIEQCEFSIEIIVPISFQITIYSVEVMFNGPKCPSLYHQHT